MQLEKILCLICLLGTICFQCPTWAGSPIWLIENNQNRVYLAGTIHLLRSSDYPLPAVLDYAYKDSQIVAFETSLDSHTDPNFAKKMVEAMSLPAHQKLEDLISEQTLMALKNHLENQGLSLSSISHLKPGMIALTLTLAELRKIGALNQGVDHYFYNQALKDRKLIQTLESPAQQLAFLATLGQGQEDLIIQHTLEDIKTISQQFEDMISSWKTGNHTRLKELFIDPMQKHFYPVYEQLLVKRNKNWMPVLINMLETPETEMVMVGTAHMLGKDGLIEQLNLAGYTVSQLEH